MIRLGIVDFDTSHAVEFTKRLNHVDIAEDQWVEGARVVAGVPGESKIAPELIPKYAEQMKKYGVPLFDDPADLFGKVDAVLIESVDGSVHLDRAMPFLEQGHPDLRRQAVRLLAGRRPGDGRGRRWRSTSR